MEAQPTSLPRAKGPLFQLFLQVSPFQLLGQDQALGASVAPHPHQEAFFLCSSGNHPTPTAGPKGKLRSHQKSSVT